MTRRLYRFFVFCAGADTKILAREECRNDRTLMATVGALVFITGVFAFVSASYALSQVLIAGRPLSHYTGSSPFMSWSYLLGAAGYAALWIASVLIGFVWGSFVFSFDRLIVMSVDKTAPLSEQAWLIVPRIILAVLISVIVATPLEVLIFSDRIQAQLVENRNRAALGARTDAESLTGLGSAAERTERAREDVSMVDSLLSEEPQSAEWFNLQSQLQTCQNTLASVQQRTSAQTQKINERRRQLYTRRANLQSEINEAINQRNRLRDTLERTDSPSQQLRQRIQELQAEVDRKAEDRAAVDRQRADLRRQIEGLKQEVQDQKAECDNLQDRLKDARDAYYAEVQSERDSLSVVASQREAELDSTRSEASRRASQDEEIISRAYGGNLISQIEAMRDLADEDDSIGVVAFFLTLLFIIIETGPVVVKLLTNERDYDRLLAATRNKTEVLIENETNYDIDVQRTKLQESKKVELDVFKKMLDEVSKVQLRIARRNLQQFEDDEFGTRGDGMPGTDAPHPPGTSSAKHRTNGASRHAPSSDEDADIW
jgi:predicted  nucleic acid-binding Zn-ribbon protein